MSYVDELRAARALIANPQMWTRGAYARNIKNEETDPNGPDAVCWCALGALHKTSKKDWIPARVFLDAAAMEMNEEDVAIVNDKHEHIFVIRMYDRAIELADLSN